MKTVNINASTNSKRIPIGRCEDNEATRVVFDCSGFSSAYGSGQATLLHRRSKEKISYIVQNVTQEDDAVTWTVSSDDTAFSGEGTLQLMWTVNDVVVHSHFYTTITDPSLTDSSSEPTEVKSALQLLIDSCYTKTEVDTAIASVPTGANWNANEGEDGYIENRPFYSETVEGEEVVHQLDSKYISGKFIASGTGENSEIFNDINNRATGSYSHAEGLGTVATANASHAGGKYNIEDTNKIYAEIIGNGTSKTNRSNARTLDWSGNERIYGTLTVIKDLITNQHLIVIGSANIHGSLTLCGVSDATINAVKLIRLLELVKDNHWESNFMIPDGYVTYNSPTIYTDSNVASASGPVCPFYYLPDEIDLDAISNLSIIARDTVDYSTSTSDKRSHVLITNIKQKAISNNVPANWMTNCTGVEANRFVVIRASDFHSASGSAYEIASNAKTIVFFKPQIDKYKVIDSYGGSLYGILSMSLDWTPST